MPAFAFSRYFFAGMKDVSEPQKEVNTFILKGLTPEPVRKSLKYSNIYFLSNLTLGLDANTTSFGAGGKHREETAILERCPRRYVK